MSTYHDEKLPAFFVYILKSSSDNRYYTGLTSRSIEERVSEHNADKSSTASTKSRGDFKLTSYEVHKSLEEAREREKFWKSGYGREIRDHLFSD
jgi:putative endonuclease